MSVIRALEIEKLNPVDNGIYICTNAKEKAFELVPLELIPVKMGNTTKSLGTILVQFENRIQKLEKNYNRLLDILMENNEEGR